MIEGERKLATIRRVAKIEPIPGADNIVKATIDGWELVTQKDNYKPGDLCVYFEIDSFLPVREEFEFLRKGCFKSTMNLGDGFHIKTIKLRGQVSQGLSLPMKDFFEYAEEEDRWYYMKDVPPLEYEMKDQEAVWLNEGVDVTEYFKVQKYEKPLPKEGGANMGRARGNFPSFIPKTDQERIQNCYRYVENMIKYAGSDVNEVTDQIEIDMLNMKSGSEHVFDGVTYFKSSDKWFGKRYTYNDPEEMHRRSLFEATLKLDGSSMTIYHNEQTYGVCSRNLDLKRDTENVFWQVATRSGIIPFLVGYGKNIAIQGELMGPGVQGNREQFKEHRFFIFDVYLIDEHRYMTPHERQRFVEVLGMDGVNSIVQHVPYIEDVNFLNFNTVADFLAYAERKSIRHDIAEGVVFKSTIVGGPSFKVISNAFLLKEKD